MVHLMDWPLSGWGYGLAPFWFGILRPLLLFVMEWSTGDTFLLRGSQLSQWGLRSIGDTVFYTSWDSRDS